MRRLFVVALCSLALGCASQAGKAATVLPPPPGSKPAAAAQIEKGNALFASRDFAAAEEAFRQAIAADAGSAEAHYNLALSLERTGHQAEAKKHYI